MPGSTVASLPKTMPTFDRDAGNSASGFVANFFSERIVCINEEFYNVVKTLFENPNYLKMIFVLNKCEKENLMKTSTYIEIIGTVEEIPLSREGKFKITIAYDYVRNLIKSVSN
jgi:hypothetical protein